MSVYHPKNTVKWLTTPNQRASNQDDAQTSEAILNSALSF